MHRPARVLWIVLGLVALIVTAVPAFADDEIVDGKRIEIWTKGNDTKELDITDLDDEGFERLHKQMLSQGYKLEETRELTAYASGRVASRITRHTEARAVVVTPPAPERSTTNDVPETPSIRRDLRELIRRGGELPEDFKPHGFDDRLPPWWTFGSHGDRPRPPAHAFGDDGDAPHPGPPNGSKRLLGASGKLILRYLEVKDDPVKGPVYASVLKDIGEALVEAAERGPSGAGRLGLALMPKVMQGMSDPETGPVYLEVMELLMASMGGPHAHPHRPEMRESGDLPPSPMFELGGAKGRFEPESLGEGRTRHVRRVFVVLEVPAGSVAARMTLEAGDRLLEIDGRAVDPGALEVLRNRIAEGGQLTLRLRRRTGETEVIDLEFAREGAR